MISGRMLVGTCEQGAQKERINLIQELPVNTAIALAPVALSATKDLGAQDPGSRT